MEFHFDNTRIHEMRKKMLVRPSICVERAKLMTESYKNTEGEPAVMRRAKAFAYILDHKSVYIYPGETIVGRPTSKIRGGSISPELQCDWILNELDLLSTRETDPFVPLTEEERKVLKEVVPYWEKRSLRYHWNEVTSERAKSIDDLILGGGAYCGNNQYPGHSSPDYSLLLKYGTEGMVKKIRERLAEDDALKEHPDAASGQRQGSTPDDQHSAQNQRQGSTPDGPDSVQSQCQGSTPDGQHSAQGQRQPLSPKQRLELEAMCICLDALGRQGARYAQEALRLAGEEKDPARKAELEEIAHVCNKVPRLPAESFREAVQSLWFGYYCIMIENWGTGNTFHRIDQYLLPYYEKSRADGMTQEEAYQYLAMLLLNCNSDCVVYSEKRSHGFAGNNSGCAFTIGGVKEDGSCAVNELSYLILEAERNVNMASDDVVVRISDNTPKEFLLFACGVARDDGGKLKFLGDKTTISNLELDGLPEKDARNYSIAGCTSPVVAGLSYDIPGGILSLPGILELALNNGVQKMTGQKLGVSTGNAADFSSFEELWDAYCRQVDYIIPLCHEIKNNDKRMFSEYAPSPFQSAFFPSCVERGEDVIDGGTKPYYTFALSMAGAPNTGDGLIAIKKAVFEEKKITMQQLLDALAANFKGYENIQSLLLRYPKFGNNEPEVDGMVNQVLSYVSDRISEGPGFKGAHSTAAAAAVTANVGLGMVLGATPDGRSAGQPISEGGISPSQGRNTSGATATMLSIAGLDHTKLRHGEVLNMRIHPDAIRTPDKLEKFAYLIRAYMDLGGFLVQFNIVSTETLRDAQIHPQAHRDLVVRVATYAAYFIELGKELQDDIIHRYEFEDLG